MEEEESKPKADLEPNCPVNQKDRISVYAHEQEDYGQPRFTILDASALYNSGDIESQDSGLGGLGALEMDIKENTLTPWTR